MMIVESCLMTSIVCNKKSLTLDVEKIFKDEIRNLQKLADKSIFNALIYDRCNNIDNNSLPAENVDYIEDSQMLISNLEASEKYIYKIFLTCLVKQSLKRRPGMIPPYTFYDTSKDVYYSMAADGDVEDLNFLLKFSGFDIWLDRNRSTILYSDYSVGFNYLFLWLVKNIQMCNYDVFKGITKGLHILSLNKIGGHFNIFFSDGSGIYAFSNREQDNANVSLLYKVASNESNCNNYILSNFHDPDDTDWIKIRPNDLYYFPLKGELKTYHDSGC